MKDFQRGWYIQLLLLMTRAKPHIGYLPLDGQLWKLAGAHSKRYWENQSALVLACFKVREIGGAQWIYNERLLAELQEQSQKVEMNLLQNPPKLVETKRVNKHDKNPSISYSSLAFEIYQQYPRKQGRRKALEEIDKAIKRLSKERHLELVEAGDFILEAVSDFSASPAGNNGQFVPYPSTWFHQDRFLDDRTEWHRSNGNGNKAEQRQQANLAACDEAIRAIHREAGLDS